MSKELQHVPRITKMAKYLQTVKNHRDVSKLGVYHFAILTVLREMNTTVQIIAGLTGISNNKVRERLNDLHNAGLASVVEMRGRGKKIWGMHDDFRSFHKVPTFPSVTQEASIELKRQKAGRMLEMDEVATILWGSGETRTEAVSGGLVAVATTLRKTPILNQAVGDREARREAADEVARLGQEIQGDWSLEDFVESDEEE